MLCIFLNTGTYFASQRHYYFTNNRYQARFSPPSKSILTNLQRIREINEEERVTVRENLAKECGYTGLSILHRLWPLYGFCYDKAFQRGYRKIQWLRQLFLLGEREGSEKIHQTVQQSQEY